MKDKIDILNIRKISGCQFVTYMLLPNIFMVWSETRRESHKHRKNQHRHEWELTCKKPSIKGANKGSLHRQVTVQSLKHHLSLLFLLSYLRCNIHQTTISNGSGTYGHSKYRNYILKRKLIRISCETLFVSVIM